VLVSTGTLLAAVAAGNATATAAASDKNFFRITFEGRPRPNFSGFFATLKIGVLVNFHEVLAPFS
jgi:hypothetical protein